MAGGRKHHVPSFRALMSGGRGTRTAEDGIDQAESWERRSRDVELYRKDVPFATMNHTAVGSVAVVGGTPIKASVTTALLDGYQFDMPQNNRIRYLGLTSLFCLAIADASFSGASGSVYMTSYIYKNEKPLGAYHNLSVYLTAAGSHHPIPLHGIVTLEHHDFLELWISTDINETVTTRRLIFSVIPLGRFPVSRAR